MTTLTITHPQLVAALVKPPLDIVASLNAFTADIWHGATGVAGESGELLEAVLFQDEEIDRVNLREELGDLYFYVEQLVQRTGIEIDWDAVTELAYNEVISPDMLVRHAGSVAVHGSQVLDTVKKAAIYNKELDTELLRNQLHALLVSMATIGVMFSLPRQECLNANIQKLSKRYASLSYSDTAAQERADKQTGTDEVVPERKPFKGEEDTRAEPRTSDMAEQAAAQKSA
jgi:hypothetical protein